MDVVDLVQEVLESTVDSEAVKECVPSFKERHRENEVDEVGELFGGKRKCHPCEGSNEIGIRPRRQEVQHDCFGRGRHTPVSVGKCDR